MLLSRFWYVVLAALAALALAALLIVRNTYDRDRGRDSEILLRGDRNQIAETLRRDARQRIDNLVPIAADPEVTRLMNTASARANDAAALRAASAPLQARLRTLNTNMGPTAQGQMLIAVDPRGLTVARVGTGETVDPGEYLGGHPLVARALDGYVRDDTWELQGHVYRMAARPVIYQGRYVGAVIHAREIDAQFVRNLSEGLGNASVAFFAGSGVYAAHDGEADRGRPAPTQAALASEIRTLSRNAEWRDRGYTNVLAIQNGQSAAVYGTIAGSVGINGGGFAVGRPRPVMPADYLLHAPSDEVKRVPWGPIAAIFLVGAGLGLLFIFLERDRGEKALRAALQDLAERKTERLDPLALRGSARKTALAINDAFERAIREELARAGGKPRRSVEDLDALLGPPGGTPSAPQFADIPPPPPVSGSMPMPAPMPYVPPAPRPPQGGPPPPPSAPPSRPIPPGTPPIGTVMPPKTPPSAVLPGGESDDNDPTNVARVPAGVANVAKPVAVAAPAAGGADFDEAAHWREVFDQFVATKKQCGEPTDTLVYDKFAATLVRHKEQLVQRTQCRAVRFQVYVKDGKATLKATPVK